MINEVILMGRLTREPEIRSTNNGMSVANFTVAVDRNCGENKQTDFINCVAWRKTAEFIGRYFNKGTMIIVQGHLQTRTYDGDDGKKKYVTEVVVAQANFGETKKARNANNGGYQNQSQNNARNEIEDTEPNLSFLDPQAYEDDLPF